MADPHPTSADPDCQYGVFDHRCGVPAVSRVVRANGRVWDLCAFHAAVAERADANASLDASEKASRGAR